MTQNPRVDRVAVAQAEYDGDPALRALLARALSSPTIRRPRRKHR